MSEGEVPDAVQQSSPVEAAEQVPEQAPVVETAQAEPVIQAEPVQDGTGEADEPNPLDPDGKRFKQVWARAKNAEAKAVQLEAERQAEREERIRLEERLRAQVEAKTAQVQPHYTWTQLQTAIDNGQIDFAKAMEIHDSQLEQAWERKRQNERDTEQKLSGVSTEMNEYKKLVPNATLPGTEERQKVEREFGYLVQRLGQPTTPEQKLSYELAAARAAFGDLDTLKTRKQLASKPVTRETHMETSSASRKPVVAQKDFKSTLSPKEVAHYERLMRNGRYPKGWDDVKAENEAYDQIKAGQR